MGCGVSPSGLPSAMADPTRGRPGSPVRHSSSHWHGAPSPSGGHCVTAATLGPASAPSPVEEISPQPSPLLPRATAGLGCCWCQKDRQQHLRDPRRHSSPPPHEMRWGLRLRAASRRAWRWLVPGGPPAEGSNCGMETLRGSPAAPGSAGSRPEWKRGRSQAGKEEKRVGHLASCQAPRSRLSVCPAAQAAAAGSGAFISPAGQGAPAGARPPP